MGLRHERAAHGVHMDTCVITHTPVTLYNGEMMTLVYNTADYVSTATLGNITVHVHKPLLRQQLKVKLYITCLQVVYSKYRPLCIVTVQVY